MAKSGTSFAVLGVNQLITYKNADTYVYIPQKELKANFVIKRGKIKIYKNKLHYLKSPSWLSWKTTSKPLHRGDKYLHNKIASVFTNESKIADPMEITLISLPPLILFLRII